MKKKASIEQKMQELIKMTAGFCNTYLDEDYKKLCEKLLRRMSRKRNVPFLSGEIKIWAAAIIHALGTINFLFDRSFEPYISAGDISTYFGISKSTVSKKAKLIRDMFKMRHWDEEFSTNHIRQNNPFSNLVMINGLIVDIESLPPDIQRLIRQRRAHKE